MGEFPSGQREQTVNLLAMPSMVRIHLPPPNQAECLLSLVFCCPALPAPAAVLMPHFTGKRPTGRRWKRAEDVTVGKANEVLDVNNDDSVDIQDIIVLALRMHGVYVNRRDIMDGMCQCYIENL